MGELGCSAWRPGEYGGSGADFTRCALRSRLGRVVDQSIGVTLEAGVGLGSPDPHLRHRRAEAAVAAGPRRRPRLAGFGPRADAGSDASATKTRAELADVSGRSTAPRRSFTNSGTGITPLVTVTAKTGADEISSIIVPSGTPGFVVEPAYEKLGWRISDTHG